MKTLKRKPLSSPVFVKAVIIIMELLTVAREDKSAAFVGKNHSKCHTFS